MPTKPLSSSVILGDVELSGCTVLTYIASPHMTGQGLSLSGFATGVRVQTVLEP